MARIKARTSKDNRKEVKKAAPHRKSAGGDTLKAQIQSLGGDVEEDYELLKDADSDGLEGAQSSSKDPKVAKDIAKFMKSLDFGLFKNAATAKGAEAPHAEGSNNEGAEDATKEKTRPKERVSNGKPDARVAEAAAKVAESTRGGKTKFIVAPTSQWYIALPALKSPSSLPTPSPEYLSSKSTLAASLLLQDVTAYTESSSHTTSTSDARFLTRVLASGTLSDRLSALTLMAQGSPVHNARALESLKAMAAKKGREESLKALRAVVDWWVGGGTPDRKLKYFRDQPLTHPDVTEQHLVLWHFEDWLKKYFFAILQLLEALSVDPLPYVRTQAMNLIFQLLRDKPEQEQNLLRLLVNKLGDSEKSVASKASHYLLQLLQTHPQMKHIIVHEVSALILRPAATPSASASASAQKPKAASAPNQKPQPPSDGNTHARYYAVITFNQIVLLPQDKDVAARLVDVYFELFRAVLGEDEHPVEEVPEGEVRDFTPKQRRGYKSAKGEKRDRKGKGKAVDLGFQEVPDGNSKLVSAILTGINRALPFARTENSATFDKHIDTLFRITHTATFNVSLQALTLIHHVSRASTRPTISDRFYRALYTSLVDPRLATSSKQAMYLNLLFKAVKADKNHKRVAAFVKRIVQVLGIHRPEFICGGLFLLGELFSTAPEVRDLTTVGREEVEPYDPRKRDPQYAHAESLCLWELLPLLHHYHPSVALHSRQLLTHAQVTATADLGLNTLSHFLDRFVYRNPKKPRAKGASAMQPTAVGNDDGGGMVRASKAAGPVDVVNEDGFRKKREGDVPVDQVFFHKFFSRKHEREQARAGKAEKRKGKRKGEGSDEDDVLDDGADDGSESEAEEAEIWKAMKRSVPELGGSDVDDGDSLGSSPPDDEEENEEDDAQSHSSDGSELYFMEDEDDLVSDLDGEGDDPVGLIEYPSDASGSEEEQEGESDGEWQGFGSEPKPKKRGRETDADEGKKKRRKLKVLPTFASYEDYAAMIENSKDEDV